MLEVRRWDSVSRRCRARSLAVLSLSVGSVGVGVVRAVGVVEEGGRADWGVLVVFLISGFLHSRRWPWDGVERRIGTVEGSRLEGGITYHKSFQLRL